MSARKFISEYFKDEIDEESAGRLSLLIKMMLTHMGSFFTELLDLGKKYDFDQMGDHRNKLQEIITKGILNYKSPEDVDRMLPALKDYEYILKNQKVENAPVQKIPMGARIFASLQIASQVVALATGMYMTLKALKKIYVSHRIELKTNKGFQRILDGVVIPELRKINEDIFNKNIKTSYELEGRMRSIVRKVSIYNPMVGAHLITWKM